MKFVVRKQLHRLESHSKQTKPLQTEPVLKSTNKSNARIFLQGPPSAYLWETARHATAGRRSSEYFKVFMPQNLDSRAGLKSLGSPKQRWFAGPSSLTSVVGSSTATHGVSVACCSPSKEQGPKRLHCLHWSWAGSSSTKKTNA